MNPRTQSQRPAAEPARTNRDLIEQWARHEVQTTTWQAPVVWDHARGMTVTDVEGKTYLDWTSGVLVTNVGHAHPYHVEAIQKAVARLMNCYDFPTAERIEAGRRLVAAAPEHLDRAFFLTTGSEATEAALRVAKRYTDRYEIVSFYGGFHGRTGGAMSAAGMPGTKKRFGPVMPGAIRVPFPYCYRCPLRHGEGCCGETLNMAEEQIRASTTGSLAAAIVEPYLGAAGFVFPPEGYLKQLEAFIREKDMLFILDEVQSSMGRTGKLFAMEHEGLTPDLVAVAKGLGSGIPASALLGRAEVLAALGQGEMSSTCGGNPVASAAVIAVLDIIEREGLVENAARIGALMKQRLLEIQQRSRHLGDVRGKGLIIGLELVEDKRTKVPARELTRKAILSAPDKGLLIGSVGLHGNVIRVAPPLVIDEDEAHRSLDIMEDVLLSL